MIPSRCLLPLLAGLLLAAPAQGATVCVATAAQLRDALEAAAASAEDDVVNLVRGQYALASSLSLAAVEGDLTLRGGFAAGCPLLGRSLDPATTRITALQPQGAGLAIYPRQGDVEIDGLAFEDLQAVDVRSTGDQVAAPSGEIRVRRSRFAGSRRGLTVFSSHKDVRIENNVFVAIETDAIKISHLAGAQAPIRVDVLFNTVVAGPRALWIEGGGPFSSAPRVQNNILRSTATGAERFSLRLDAVQVAATNNVRDLVDARDGGGFAIDAQNLDADPVLDAGLVPQAGSPALNSGTDFVFGGVPSTDHDGGPRTIGSRPDRGALESAISDIGTITVTSTANSGPGTLRQAILDSNQTSNAETIAFNLGPAGGCPYHLVLDTLLPAVTSPLTIDGFTQPGSAPNDHPRRYEAVHCVVLRGSVAQGLRLQPAPGEAMTVRGLAFQGFSVAALEADGDGRAIVQGNSFGVPTGLLPAGFAGDAIRLSRTHSSLVGGTDPAASNLVGNAAGAGIRLTGCTETTVRRNFIGVRGDGFSERGNGTGVFVSDSEASIADNVIGFSATQGVRVEGADSLANIAGNHIGVAMPDDDGARRAISNGGNGIRLLAGDNHTVAGNRVANNFADGIVVLDAVDSAQLDANRIYENAGLGIDLSPDDVDPQDSDLVDNGGGNRGQNFPLLLEAYGSNNAGIVRGELRSSTGEFDLQFFAGTECDDSSHGEGERFIGSTRVSIASGPGGSPVEGTVAFSAAVSSAVGLNLGLLGRPITATATRRTSTFGGGPTSEFSACLQYVQGPEIFRDGFEGD